LAAQLLARRFELTALPADAARPGILPQGVDHGTTNAALGEGLELDAPRFIEPMSGVDQPDDAVLDEVTDIDRMRHGGRHPAGELLNERDGSENARVVGAWLRTHQCDPPPSC
jgi:hypothetical protein